MQFPKAFGVPLPERSTSTPSASGRGRARAAWLALLIVLPALASRAQAQEPEHQPPTLEGLQKQIDELRADLAHRPTSSTKMKIFGRLHIDSWNFLESDDGTNVFETGDPQDDPSNEIEIRRARIGVSGDIGEDMLYKTEFDYGKPEDLTFKDLYFGFRDLPVVQTLLIGNQKRPYGLDHLNSSNYNVFMERPFVVEGLNEDARRLGVVAYGNDAREDWSWRYGVYDMVAVAANGEDVTHTLQPEIAGRLAHTLWWRDDGRSYGHCAISGSLAFPNSDPGSGDDASQARFRTRPEARSQSRWIDTGVIPDVDDCVLVGLEGVANFGSTQVVAEVMNAWVQRSGPSEDLVFPGGYVYVAHYLTGESMPWDRRLGILARPKPNHDLGHGGGAWQVALRLSYADFSDEDIFGGRGQAVTLGLNWLWNAHASMQMNYIHGRISDRDVVVGPTTYDQGDYDILGVRLRVDF
jgi:phosphate-selective porin OprO and OprP